MNHVKTRARTAKDNIHSVLNVKTEFTRENNLIIVPEPGNELIVYWSRKKSEFDKSIHNDNRDKLLLECLKWPLKTRILCYNCCHAFEGVPVPLPTIYDKKRNIYFCHGNFCSWRCSKAYNINEMPKAGQGNRNMNISLPSRHCLIRKTRITTLRIRKRYILYRYILLLDVRYLKSLVEISL